MKKSTYFCLLLVVLCVHKGWSQEESVEPDIAFFRAEEDYSSLVGRKKTKTWQKLKAIPLFSKSYLSIGGEGRIYPIMERNERWNEATGSDLYWRVRAMLHTNWVIAPGLRFFGQVFTGNTLERGLPVIPVDRDDFDFAQLFSEFSYKLRGSSTKSYIRIGRQELNLGGHQIVKVREGTNARQSFDGIRILNNVGKIKVDMFYATPVDIEPGALDNKVFNNDKQFFGINIVRLLKDTNLRYDVYYFGFLRDEVRYQNITGEENRHTVGARSNWTVKNWSFDYEFSYQFGDIEGEKINAWGLATFSRYTLAGFSWKPVLEVKFSYTTGDKNEGDGRLNAFNPLFPRGNYFGETAILTGINILNPGAALELSPKKEHDIRFDLDLLWRSSKNDGLYIPPDIFFISGQVSDENYIGTQLTTAYNIDINQFTNVVFAYSHVFTGKFIDETLAPVDVDLVSGRVQVRF